MIPAHEVLNVPDSLRDGTGVKKQEHGGLEGDPMLQDVVETMKADFADPSAPLMLKQGGKWHKTPQVVGQYIDPKLNHTKRLAAPVPCVFNLCDSNDVERLAELLKRLAPVDNPEISINVENRVVVGDKWLMYVSYSEYEYQEIISEKKPA